MPIAAVRSLYALLNQDLKSWAWVRPALPISCFNCPGAIFDACQELNLFA